jgi:DNA-binding XRE family transcriptional regulator
MMQRVHRHLTKNEVEALRAKLTELVPEAQADIPDVLRLMRLITRKSQTEYAKLCGVAPRVLARLESGKGSPTLETLEKLIRPFGYRVGVMTPTGELTHSMPKRLNSTGRGTLT